MLAEIIAAGFRKLRIPLSDEKEAQRYIADGLTNLNIPHQREYRLGLRDIVDFWLPEGGTVGSIIEVKMNGARAADVYRQLKRYAAYPLVSKVFLVTNRAMGLPAEIEGKPTYYVSLGRAWL